MLQAMTLAAAAVAAVIVLATGYAAWDARYSCPDQADMEAIAGVSLGEPTFRSTRMLHRWRRAIRASWIYYTLPIPNQMAVWPAPADTWSYPLESAPPYVPPPGSPLNCGRGGGTVVCEADQEDWSYRVTYDATTAAGAFTATLRHE